MCILLVVYGRLETLFAGRFELLVTGKFELSAADRFLLLAGGKLFVFVFVFGTFSWLYEGVEILFNAGLLLP